MPEVQTPPSAISPEHKDNLDRLIDEYVYVFIKLYTRLERNIVEDAGRVVDVIDQRAIAILTEAVIKHDRLWKK